MQYSNWAEVARLVLVSAALCAATAGLAGCGDQGGQSEGTNVAQQDLAGSLSISGTISDAAGNPQAGVTVRLGGGSQATATTTVSGTYAFNNLGAGSYAVQVSRAGCTFMPDAVNVNGMTASTVVNFDGSGTNCGGPAQNTGAKSGAFSISGRVANAAGNPVSGVRLTLNGAAQGLRTTTATGTYSFQVNAGSYSVQPSGPCTLTPNVANLGNVNANRAQNFVAGTGCVATPSGGAGGGSSGGAGGGSSITPGGGGAPGNAG